MSSRVKSDSSEPQAGCDAPSRRLVIDIFIVSAAWMSRRGGMGFSPASNRSNSVTETPSWRASSSWLMPEA